MTHAFFKALLFLAGGVLIHALTGEQDIRRMGGLGRRMPHTRIAFLIGSLALVGVPPFAGFFSKDSIIAALLNRGTFGVILGFCALIGTFLTGVYAFRLYFIVFHGEESSFAKEHLHLHHGKEGPLSMVWTVTALAGLSVVGGFLQFAPFWHPLSDWLKPVARPFAEATNTQEAVASVCAVLFGLIGIYVAWSIYMAKSTVISPLLRALAPVAERKFYWDELYDWAVYRPAVLLSQGLGRFVERPLIAGTIREVSVGFGAGSRAVGRIQNGLVRSYALALAGGVAVLMVVFLSTR
jgi:NADH-quinone oxidoreductase subunit L